MSPTRVVNLHVDPYDVYIGRAGRGEDGYFGNPVRLGRPCPVCGGLHHTRGDTISCYQHYLEQRLVSDPVFKERVRALRGKTLGCFCKPRACHGDLLAEAADTLED